MTTGRLIFKSKILEKKYGLKGKVASHYLKAGYQVSIPRNQPVDIIAVGNKNRFVIKVVARKNELTSETIKGVQEYAKRANARAIIAIYGGLKVDKEFIENATSSGVKLKRIRD